MATTASAADGSYSFTGLAPGYDYLVKVDKADADLQTYFNSKYDPDPVSFQLSTAEASASPDLTGSDSDNDFGFWRAAPASVGDQLFIDADGDGQYDAGETPVANVTVTLYRDGVAFATAVSGPDGTYLFDNLGPGSYTVKVDTADADLPAGLMAGVTEYSMTLNAGDAVLNADFPFAPALDKSVNKDYVNPAGTVADRTLTYTLYPRFPSSAQLSSYIVEDPIPAGTTYAAGSVGQGGIAIDNEDVGEPGYGVIDSVAWDLGSTTKGAPAYKGGAAMCPATLTVVADKDTHLISGTGAGNNAGASTQLNADPDAIRHMLLHFDVSTIPAGAEIDYAEVRVTVSANQDPDRTVSVRKLTYGPWTEGTGVENGTACASAGNGATWNAPNCTDSTAGWNGAGGAFATAPYGSQLGTISPASDETTYAVDVTGAVDDWYRDGASSNYGLALLAVGTADLNTVKFHSRTGTDGKRPTLVVNYRAPIPDGCSGTVTLAAEADTYIDKNALTNNFGTATTVKLRPEAAKLKAGLLRFNVAGIPVGSVIDSAAMQVTVKTAKTGHTYGVRQLLTPFVGTAATWNDADGAGTGDWATGGVFGASDYASTAVGSINAGTTGMKQVDVTALVHAWRTTPASNYGVTLLPTATANLSKDSEIYSREGGTDAQDPKIVVNWRIDPPNPDRVTMLEVNKSLVVSGDTVKVTMTLENDALVDRTNTVPSALTVVPGAPGASATCGAPTPASLTVPAGETRTVEYVCTLTYAGNVNPTGSLTFTGNATSDGGIVWGIATSNSTLVSPLLTFQVVVDTPVTQTTIENAGHVGYTSPSGDGTATSNTVQTATSASIGDFVWADADGDGAQDTGEVGLAGVKVYVDSNGNGAWDAGEPYDVTDATGEYRIFGLDAGTYTVRTDPATYPAGYLPTTAPVLTVTDLTAGQQYSAADFGLKPAGTGQIGDTIWLDADKDGVQDADEAPLPGIGVTLEQQIGGVWYPMATATTGADGKYLFDGLIAGDYRVTVDPDSTVTSPYGGSYPLGTAMAPTYDKDGGIAAPNGVAEVNLSSDSAIVTDIDFGYRWAGSIAGTGWYDTDSDGAIDSGEVGAPGSSIVLYLVNADGSHEILAFFETSAANGYDYLFANLPPGNYAVGASEQEVPAPAGSPNAGAIGTMVFTTPEEYPVPLAAGQTVTDKDFGFVEAALLEGTLFHDANASAVLDAGEPGLSGIVITLTGTDANGNPVTRTATTDANGAYSFIVPAGNYTISYDPVAVAAAFPGLTTATTPASLSVSAETGHEYAGLDFGVDHSGAIGDRVWADADRDGVQDAGEAGLAGVTVYLCASSPCAEGNALAVTATDASGEYSFTGLADGAYYVGVNTATAPAGYTATTVHAGSDTAIDSGNPAGEAVTISGGATDDTVDFGLQPPAGTYSISGNLWNDNGGASGTAGDGVLDTGEPYLGGVTVCLYASDGTTLIACTVTDASGNYSFPGMSNGSYVVKVDTTTLPAAYFVQSKDPDSTLDDRTTVTVSGADVAGQNFAYWQQPGSISGSVCVGGSNGICDTGEPLVKDVTITLVGAGPDGILGTADDTTDSTTTDSSGYYEFTDLLPGLYQVVKTNPLNTTGVADRDGGNPDNITEALAGNEDVTTRDFEVHGGADLAVTKSDGQTIVTSPQTGVVYTLVVANNGILPAENVVLNDTVGTGLTYVSDDCGMTGSGPYVWTIGTLAVGASVSCKVTVNVASGLADGTTVRNYAAASTTTVEPNITNNEQADLNTVQTAAAPDLQITKTDGQTQVLAGAALAYTINYKNVGNADAASVVIVDALPANVVYVSSSPAGTYDSNAHTVTWSLGTVAQGADVNITLNVTVKAALLPGAAVLNRVNITTTGTDRNPLDNSAVDSDIVVAPYVVLEKSVTGPAYVGAEVTYSIRWQNNSTDTANDVIITDVLPANTTLVAGSITDGGTLSGSTITWNLGNKAPGASGTVSFKVTVLSGVTGSAVSQTAPTLSTETGTGSVTITSTTTARTALPWCATGDCLTYRGLFLDANPVPPTGWNDNPRATAFAETGWTQPVASSTAEYSYWMPAGDLDAEWSTVNTTGLAYPNYTYFRQAFCLPLNASGLDASLDLAGDDRSTVYLNGVPLGQHTGAGSYSTLSGDSGIQSGINLLAVQLINNTHGGHPSLGGLDHSGLLFNLQASYDTLRPFAYAPATILAGQTATFTVDENALGGRTPYFYRYDWGDGTPAQDYTEDLKTTTHTYATPGTYVATVTARAQYGCTGADTVTITVLPDTSKILANTANVAYENTAGASYTGESGAGILLSVGAVTGLVYTDVNGDGVYTAGVDAPAEGVNVSVTDAHGVVHTGVTGVDGTYTITEVGAGYAAVTLLNPPSGVQTQGTNPTTGVLITAGQTTTEENNGFYNPTALGNRVWLDENGDGIQDAGEAGIPNVTVELWNSDHTVLVAATVTDADGNYVFKGISAGTYQVDVLDTSLPTGLVHSTPTFTGDFTNKADPYTVTITGGSENMTADFGYNWAPSADVTGSTNTGAIGDRVWIDADGDGVQDPEELGLSGVTVELWYDSNGDGAMDALYPGGTATTDATGRYAFDGLPAGSYLVKITAGVTGYTQTGDPDAVKDGMTTQPIVLAPGDVFVNADFGYQPGAGMAATIGDTIWLDADASGTQDTGEPGIPGVTVALIGDTNGNGAWDAGEPILATDTTDADGGYQFTAPAGGDYLVWVNDTANVLGGLAPSYDSNGVGTPNLSAVTDLPTTGNDAQDFGYKPFGQTSTTGLIGDTIFLDRDGSGGYTAGEGLEGVTVKLYDSAGTTLLAATVTDENGRYTFPALPAGTYTVQVDATTLPAGLTNTVDPDSGTAHRATVTLTAGQINLAQDFGYQGANSVAGTLWADANADGILSGETGRFAGVTVALYDANGNVVATTVTGSDGSYSFAHLPNGSYTVRVTDEANLLNGYWHSLGTANTDNNSQSDPLTVNLTGSTEITYADFGYYREPASLGNFVWQDDGDGIQESGEPGLAGVEVTLTITWPGGATTKVTTTTDANGAYSFGNLLLDENFNGAGTGEPTFNISVATPAGYLPTLTDQGGDAADSDPNGVTATVTQGTSNTSYDFGLIPLPGAIGNTVWLDENGNGVQDAGEAGIPNAKVTLTGADIYGVTVSLTTYTDAVGGYVFADVLPGSYTVTVDSTTLPAGLAANPTYDEDGSGTAHTSPVTLLPGEEHLTADFGYNWAPVADVTGSTGPGAIGDRVWVDADGDGVQDPGEPGLGGVTVSLTNLGADGIPGTSDDTTATATTAADGSYVFDGLAAGAYVVEVTNGTTGYAQTGDPDATLDNRTTAQILLAPGDVYVNADFGYQPAAGSTIGDLVYMDANGDGTYDAGEPGIAGVTVALLDSTGKVIATTTTDKNGAYTFTGLPAGDYTVWVNDTANVLGELDQTGDPDATLDSRHTLTVDGSSAYLDNDFGYAPIGQTTTGGLIGDTIYLDRDGGSDYDAGEGLEGVIVRLYADTNGDGNYDLGEPMLTQTVTDENGAYAFGGLPAGAYVVMVDTATLPAGVTNTVDPDTSDSPLNEAGVTLTAGQINLAQDFGYDGTNSISGTLWTDTNADGALYAAETGRYAGVTMALYDANGNVVATTTTDSSGNYSFANLPDGTYRVGVTDDANILNGVWLSDGPNDGINNNSQVEPYTVTVSGGQTDETADFGYYREPASLGNFVWEDDGDGIQETGEPGLAGIEVTLTITWPGGATTAVTTVTDAAGAYSFGNLLLDEHFDGAGTGEPTFSIAVATPAGYAPTLTDQGADDALDSDDPAGAAATVTQGQLNSSVDFGFVRGTASVSGTVFDDLDGDGQQDAGEPGIPGVTVTLDDGDPGTALLTATTDALGNYEFTSLLPGAYTITETDPAGYTSTGDADGANDNTIAVTLAAGENVTERDFGDERPGSIAGVVFEDANNNGVQDAGEGPLAGVTVCASPDGGVTTFCDTTDATGAYLIPNVPPGDYVVSETDPAGYVSTTPNTLPVSVSSGEAVAGVNYGDEPPTADTYTVAGTVCENTDGDGVCDAGETLLPGVTVALYDAGGNLVATTTTDASGDYLFVNVPDGTYEVREVDPAGYTSVNDADGGADNTVAVTVSGAAVSDKDFVDAPTPGALSGTVYEDLNLNGQYDAGEPGIAGVTVTLDDGDPGTASLTATTDANGAYSFTNLAPGVYTVTETDPTGTVSTGDVDGANDNTIVATVNAGQTTTGQDFGDAELGSLSGTVWDDLDADGIQDAGELPLAGVLVCLTPDGAGVPVCDTTDATGGYEFLNLIPGGYTVVETDPAGYVSTTASSVPVTVPSGGAEVVNFGDVQPDPALGSISGAVCEDANGDGVCDADEAPLAGVTVELRDATTGALLRTTTTDADGDYSFPNLPDGSYRVVEVDPAGYTSVNDADGGADSTISPITIASGSDAINQDFVDAVVPGTIGNTVWLDENGNGVQDAGEAGIPNLTVTLTGTDSHGNAVLLTTYTDAVGGYVFSGLAPSDAAGYTITVTPLAGLVPTYDENGIVTANATTVVLAAGQEHLTADFGYNWAPASDVTGSTGTGAIGDRVWIDADGDGVQDPGEPGLGGVTVSLTNLGADGIPGTSDDTTTTTTTAADGSYVFDGLAAGAYVVEVTNGTTGYAQTGDPDATPDNRTTAPILLAPGDVYVNADFGYQPAAGTSGSIGDTVWLDADRDNAVDTGEPGIPGVTVALIRDSNGNGVWDAGEPIIATDITDASGAYSFSGLPVTDGAGTDDYLVWVSDTANVLGALAPTYDADGAAPATGVETGLGISAVTDLTTTAVTDADFAYAPAGHDAGEALIGDTIYLDRDGSGGYNTGEGLEGVTVRLYAADGTTLLATTTTDENGGYAFGGLAAGTYVVQVDLTTLPGTAGQLTNSQDPDGGTTNQSTVTVTAGQINLAQDFGYRDLTSPNTITGTLWNDSNADGALSGEAGVYAGVTVVLRDSNGNIVATTTTDADGNYTFSGLPDGTYTVDVTDTANVLDGLWHSTGTAGADNQSQSDPYTVAVSGGATYPADFGYYGAPAALGDWVWNDANADGIQDSGEVVLAGVVVQLTITWPNATTTVVRTVTDADGYYAFENLLLDENYDGVGTGEPTYAISIPTLPGTASPTGQGTPATDSNDPAGATATLVESFFDVTYDFGFSNTEAATIGGVVYDDNDTSNDNLIGGDDLPQAGVMVSLYRDLNGDGIAQPGELVGTTVTAADGSYSFPNLANGAYLVIERDPAGATSEYDTQGTATDNTIAVTLSGGSDSLGNSFLDDGATTASIAGSVYDDAGFGVAGDGAFGGAPADAAIPGVLVSLYLDTNNNGLAEASELVDTTATDATGAYSFANLPNGAYLVVETDPSGATSKLDTQGTATDNLIAVPLAGTPSNGNDFLDDGATAWTVSGTVYNDSDANQAFSGGDTTLTGGSVALYADLNNNGVVDAGDQLVATQATTGAGAYSFANVPDGNYLVVETDPAGYSSLTDSGEPDAANDANTIDVTVNGANNPGNNFLNQAPQGTGSIGNTVWLDENGNGVQDAGEAGIPNLTVTLTGTDSNGNPVSLMTVTDLNGGYVFSGLPASDASGYTVTVTPSAGLAPTYDENGLATANTTNIVLAAGQEHLTADFGYNWAPASDVTGSTGTGAIGDRVWVDADGDGVQDPGEPGLGGVTVSLTNLGADGIPGTSDDTTTTTTTAADGSYVFDGLAAGAYVVEVTNGTTGYAQTGDPDATLDNRTTAPLLLAPGDVYVNADFGYRLTSDANTIGDRIFLDANGDGNLDAGEPGLAGVTVALLDGSGKIIATTTTDAAGAYSFSGLPDGTYTVWVNDTAHVLGALAQNSTPNNAADGGQTCGTCTGRNTVTVSGGTGSAFQDFGYAPAGHDAGEALIGDTIYLDRDGGGAYTPGEGLEGVTVRLYADTNGDGNYDTGEPMLAETVTDENGAYFFGNLPAGNYVVTVDPVTLPAGLTNTVDPDTSDSPLNEAGVTLATGSLINLAQDFGYTAATPGTVSGTLWNDSDADGALEAAEAGRYGGVTVALLDSNGDVVATTTTAADGSYSFAGLPAGSYTVDVTDAANVLDGAWHSLGTANTAGQSQTDPKPVTVTAGGTTVTDFGYYRNAASLGNFVWYDPDKDGIQDAGEPGIDGVLVILTITYPNSAVTTVTTVTGDDPATPAVTEKGWYSFGNLLLDENYRTSSGAADPGANQPAYTISVVTPANYLPTLVNATDSTLMNDSDKHAGTYGLATKGQTDVKQGGAVLLAAMNAALGVDGGPGDESNPIASYDFGFIQDPTAVELSSFGATFENGTVTLEWVTVSETDNLGFNVYRADGEAGPWARLNAALIPAIEPGSRLGHTYTWSDTTVLPNTAYVYRLEALDLYGEARILATIEVTGRPANRIWLPLVARSQ